MESVNAPASANITEFWQAPLFSVAELASAGVARLLYLLSAFRCVNKATESLLDNSARQSAAVVLDTIQNRL